MYGAIFWVNASSAANALNSFQEIADTLQLPVSGEKAIKDIWNVDIVRTVLRWLKEPSNGSWLVVIDSADNPEWGVRNLIPTGSRGSVIVTSLLEKANLLYSGDRERLEVYTMNDTEAETLLLKDIEPPSLANEERLAAKQVIEVLENLPLAIDLARAVIKNSRHRERAVRRYLDDLRSRKDKTLKKSELRGLNQYQKTLVDVWNISMSAVQTRDPSAASLLKFLSFFDARAIQDELWRLASQGLQELRKNYREDDFGLPEWLDSLLQYEDSWKDSAYEDALSSLGIYSIIRPSTGEWRGVSMHSLVQWRSKAEIPRDDFEEWSQPVFIFQLAASFQQLSQSPEFRRHLVIHLKTPEQLTALSTLNQFNWIFGRVFADEGLLLEAEKLQVDVNEKRTAKLGPDHPDTLTSMANLAVIYWN